jgi:mono/diheme cytochrome c family protein
MLTRNVAVLAVLCVIGSTPVAWAAPSAALDANVHGFFEQYCVRCHGPQKQKGDFRIDLLSPKVGYEDTSQWLEVMSRITSGEMPPKKQKVRPGAEESAHVVEWLSARMKEGEAARMAALPPVSYNRLTRDEYVNTVRDLLGVEFDATDPGAFLDEPEWHGFERIGSVLTLSPTNIERYLSAAEVILAEAYPDKKPAAVDVLSRAPLRRSIQEP